MRKINLIVLHSPFSGLTLMIFCAVAVSTKNEQMVKRIDFFMVFLSK